MRRACLLSDITFLISERDWFMSYGCQARFWIVYGLLVKNKCIYISR